MLSDLDLDGKSGSHSEACECFVDSDFFGSLSAAIMLEADDLLDWEAFDLSLYDYYRLHSDSY